MHIKTSPISFPTEMHTVACQVIDIRIFIVALSIVAPKRTHSKHISIIEWIKSLYHAYVLEILYNNENKLLLHATTWMDLINV